MTIMKTILLPVEANSTFESSFTVASLLAKRFEGRVDGVALKPGVITFVTADPVVVLVSQPDFTDAEAAPLARTE